MKDLFYFQIELTYYISIDTIIRILKEKRRKKRIKSSRIGWVLDLQSRISGNKENWKSTEIGIWAHTWSWTPCGCWCIPELTSRGDEEEEGRVWSSSEESFREETWGLSGREIVLPNSLIAGSLTSDIPVVYCCY